MDAKQFAKTIRPAVRGESDKYSWLLFQRAAKNGRERVYMSSTELIDGKPFTPSIEMLKSGNTHRWNLMIGAEITDGWFHGNRIMNVCRGGRAKGDWAYGPDHDTANWLDVTDWFWREYQERGRCIIWGDQVHQWVDINANARKCAGCGKHERRTVKTVRKSARVEIWASEQQELERAA